MAHWRSLNCFLFISFLPTFIMRYVLAAIALFLLLPLAHAELDKVQIYAGINADNTVANELDYYFSAPLGPGVVNYTLSQPVINMEISGDAVPLVYRND